MKPKVPIDLSKMKETTLKLIKFLDKKQIKMKQAIILDKQRHRTRLFRSDDFEEVFKIEKNKKFLDDLFKEYNLPEHYSTTPLHYLDALVQCGLLMTLERFNDPTDPKKYKYPKKVEISKNQKIDFEKMNFLTFTIKPKKSRIFPIIIISIVLALCLFPIWPLKVRLVVFYISLYFLIFVGIFSIIRFLIYYFMRLIGFEFWILPEIFENDSFKPYYSFSKIEETTLSLVIRVMLITGTICYLAFLILVPQSYEGLGDLLIESYDEVVEWGKDKVAFNFTKDISNMTITYEKLIDSDEEQATQIEQEKLQDKTEIKINEEL